MVTLEAVGPRKSGETAPLRPKMAKNGRGSNDLWTLSLVSAVLSLKKKDKC